MILNAAETKNFAESIHQRAGSLPVPRYLLERFGHFGRCPRGLQRASVSQFEKWDGSNTIPGLSRIEPCMKDRVGSRKAGVELIEEDKWRDAGIGIWGLCEGLPESVLSGSNWSC